MLCSVFGGCIVLCFRVFDLITAELEFSDPGRVGQSGQIDLFCVVVYCGVCQCI